MSNRLNTRARKAGRMALGITATVLAAGIVFAVSSTVIVDESKSAVLINDDGTISRTLNEGVNFVPFANLLPNWHRDHIYLFDNISMPISGYVYGSEVVLNGKVELTIPYGYSLAVSDKGAIAYYNQKLEDGTPLELAGVGNIQEVVLNDLDRIVERANIPTLQHKVIGLYTEVWDGFVVEEYAAFLARYPGKDPATDFTDASMGKPTKNERSDGPEQDAEARAAAQAAADAEAAYTAEYRSFHFDCISGTFGNNWKAVRLAIEKALGKTSELIEFRGPKSSNSITLDTEQPCRRDAPTPDDDARPVPSVPSIGGDPSEPGKP